MKTPPIVSPQEWQTAREELLVKEKELTRARDAMAAERRRMPWMAVEKDYRVRGAGRAGEPGRPVRGPPPADRLPRLLRAGRHHLPGAGGSYPERACVGCSFGRRPGRAPRPSERAGHDARLCLARPPGRDPGL